MNTHARDLESDRTTHAANGLVRRRWTLSEIERMVSAGIVHEDERIELIDGEVVAMSPKGRRHEIVRHELAFRWTRQCPDTTRLAVEPVLRLDEHNNPEPDILLYPAHLVAPDVRGDTALLVVEVSDTSLSYDLTIKAPLYAAFNVREYWVIDAKTLATTVHREPGPGGYASVREVGPDQRIEPVTVPGLGLRLADLKI